jgi:hypothetical protein
MPSMPAEERCAERAKLADALARAVSDVYAKGREFQRAKDRKENTLELYAALQAAREYERALVRSYDQHLKNHGCKA